MNIKMKRNYPIILLMIATLALPVLVMGGQPFIGLFL